MSRPIFLAVAAGLVLVGALQTSPPASVSAAGQSAQYAGQFPRQIATGHLPNLVQVHEKVFSGGMPDGDAAFEELRLLGVKTIISVDGAKPDVETAAENGLRYVHLPHGYDGIPETRVQELAKAVRDLQGPVYIHCHHGKHRSPAAASVACVAAGMLPGPAARSVLELAGTSPNYRGLYQSADEAKPLAASLLDDLKVEFRETVEVPPLAEAMVALERTQDHLNEIAAAGWRTPAQNPDLAPAHEALLLREHFTELLRTDEVKQQPEHFQQLLRDSEAAAQMLEAELQSWMPSAVPTSPPRSLAQTAQRIAVNCKACHQRYRDVPLSEK